MPSQTIIFDLEGTLIQLKVDDSKVLDFLLGELRRLNPGANFQRAYGVAEILRQAEGKVESTALEETKKSVSKELAEAEVACATSTTVRKDARNAISSLQSKGIKAGVITGLSEKGAKEALKHANLEGTVTIFGSRDDSMDRKERIATALKKSGSKPDDTILVADGPRDVAEAKASGVRCFAVFSQENPVNQVLASKPDAFLFSVSELEDTMLLFAQQSHLQQPKHAAEAGAAKSAAAPEKAQSAEAGPETTGGP